MYVIMSLNVKYVKILPDEFNLAMNLFALRSINIRKYLFFRALWSTTSMQ